MNDSAPARPTRERSPWERWAVRIILALSALIFVLGTTARLSGFEVWDDGLMFARYAENLARDGVVAWNPASEGSGEPTWGLTSMGHLAWVSATRTMMSPLGADAVAWVVAAGWLAGWAFVALVLWAAWNAGDGSEGVPRVTWTAACLGLGFGSMGAHFGTGMDTMTALCWLTVFLLLVRAMELSDTQTWELPTTVALVSGATFFVRPDATLFPAAVLVALVVWGPDRRARRRALAVSAGAALTGGLLWLVARTYFGTALPLPFYVKSGGRHYGDAFAAEYAGVAGHELWLFALAFWLPILVILLDAAVGPKSWWRATTALEKGLAAGTASFVLYHLTQVAPIMGGSQRFYQPALPALLWLSWGAFERLRERRKGRIASSALVLAVVVGLALSAAAEGARLWRTLQREPWPTLDLETAWQQRARHYWPALDVVAGLPPEVVIAATEVGLPGAMNPGKVVIDLAGLHDPAFALHGFSAAELFRPPEGRARRPDVVYLPHPHYDSMLRELLAHPVLRDEYRVYEAQELGSVLGVAVRRGSLAEAPLTIALDRVIAARSRR